MGYLTLGILGFTLLALLFGALVGCLRGRNRAVLRLGLLLLTVVLAILLRGVVYDTVAGLELNFDGKMATLPAYISETLAESFDGETPEALNDLCLALTEILIGLVAFFLLFIVIRLISWLIVFPILKLFVKRGEKRRRGIGALVGLLQGAMIAFVICAPLTGLLVQTDRLSKIEMEGKPLFEAPPELGLTDYLDSAPGTVYDKTGAWFFSLLSTVESASGTKVSIEDTCDVLTATTEIVEKVTQLSDRMDRITAEDATVEERADAIRGVGDALIEIGDSIDSLSGDAKDLAEDLIGSLVTSFGGEDAEIPPEVTEVLEDLELDDMDLAAVGGAVNSIAGIVEREGGDAIAPSEANAIVDGIAKNAFLLDIIAPEGEEPPVLLEVSGEDASTFEAAIATSELSAEQKDILRTMLGIS